MRRFADPRPRRDWTSAAPSPRLDGLTREERDILAAGWLRDALDEHASIASFARFSLQLLAVGAPPELLRAAQRASLDEIAHAELCFALASAYAGETLGPGKLAPGGALDGADQLERVVRSAIAEGCVGETESAMVALASAEHCDDPAVARVWRRIAADETRHAGLAWRFVKWAVARDRGLGDAVRAAFAEVCAVDVAEAHDAAPRGWLERHGRLSASARTRIAARTRREIVAPCADALLAEDGGARDASRLRF